MAIQPPTLADRYRRWPEGRYGVDASAVKTLTREEAQALRDREPSLSPWRVVVVQAGVGVALALLAAWVVGREGVALSVFYGALCVVVPGALMARGMTSRLSRMTPGAGAVSFMLWEAVKIAVSVALLMLAPKLVPSLSWPALLAGLVVCMKVYWMALLWRPAARRSAAR